jgi:hypothetical protein
MIYNPVIQPYFGAADLSVMDWLTAVFAALLYMLVRLFQRHTRKHTRKAVLALHHEVLGAKA